MPEPTYYNLRVPNEDDPIGGEAMRATWPSGRPNGVHLILAERSDGKHMYQVIDFRDYFPSKTLRGKRLTPVQAEVFFGQLKLALACLEHNRMQEYDENNNPVFKKAANASA